ncbi:MAG: J domain-containing protein [Clostridiales bacterium]|nr:J domain-containing protein [Clostridiales bacterium]
MNVISIKRSLREMKRLEVRLRFGDTPSPHPPLVWEKFFDLQNTGRGKYTLDALALMDRETYQSLIGEYWSFVYNELIGEMDFRAVRYDTDVLLRWGLGFDADEAAVKRRFRALAKRHHPDAGGNAEDFIELMRDYRKLVGK